MTDNYKTLFSLKTLKYITNIFTESFFILYFMSLSNNNIISIGLYYLIMYTVVMITIYMLKNLCYSNKRIWLLRTGILLRFLFFILILTLKNNVINYIYVLAFIYGLGEGFYYAIYNNLEAISIDNKDRPKFIGTFTAVYNIVGIIIPLLLGYLININGFANTSFLIIIMVILQLIFSHVFKDKKMNSNKKADIPSYINHCKKDILLQQMFKDNLLVGVIYGSGGFSLIVNLYIIKIFNNNLSLGIFTSIFAIVSSLIGILFAKVIKEKSYSKCIVISTIIMIASLYIIMLKFNYITIIIFKFAYSLSRTIVELIIETTDMNISNKKDVKNKYKVEYFINYEFGLYIGRLISYTIFIIYGFTTTKLATNLILSIFVIFMLILSIESRKTLKLFYKEHS